jgi:hypothetical protein
LRQIHNLFHSEFTRQCYLVLPLSTSSIFSFPYCHLVDFYVFFLAFQSPFFSSVFPSVLEGSFYARYDQSSYIYFTLLQYNKKLIHIYTCICVYTYNPLLNVIILHPKICIADYSSLKNGSPSMSIWILNRFINIMR